MFLPNYSNGRLLYWIQEQLSKPSSECKPEIFAGKSKNNKVVPIFIQPYEYKTSKKSQKYFLMLIMNAEKDLSDLKQYTERAHYIVDHNKKLINMNSFGSEFILKLNKNEYSQNNFSYLTDLFPELQKFAKEFMKEKEELYEKSNTDNINIKGDEQIQNDNSNYLEIEGYFPVQFTKVLNNDVNKLMQDYEPETYNAKCKITPLQGLKNYVNKEKNNEIKLYDIQLSIAIKTGNFVPTMSECQTTNENSNFLLTEKDVIFKNTRIVQDFESINSYLANEPTLTVLDLCKNVKNHFNNLFKITEEENVLKEYFRKMMEARQGNFKINY